MKFAKKVILTLGMIAIAATFAANADATSYYWYGADTTLGGSGTWSTSDPAWSSSTASVSKVAWSSGADTALFYGAGNTVTIGSGVTFGAVTFANASSGWVFTGAAVTYGTGSGIVSLSNDAVTWQTDIALNSQMSLQLMGSSKINFTGVISGGANNIFLTEASAWGTGTVTYSNDGNSYTGGFMANNGRARITSLADSGVNSAAGAGTWIQVGSSGNDRTAYLDYIGTGDASTNRAMNVKWRLATSSTNILNDSPTNANLKFDGTWNTTSTGVYTGTAYIRFGGISTGSTTVSGAIADSVATTRLVGIVAAGSGTLVFSGANTFTGSVTIANGAKLQIGGGSTTGSISAPVTDDGTLYFNRSNDYSFGYVIGGSGSVAQIGAGMLTLGTTNTYTGTTTVAAGTLNVTGSLAYNGADKIKVQVIDDAFDASTPTIVRAAPSGLAMAGVGSSAIGGDYVGVASFLGGTTSEALAMSMAWRNPTTTEKNAGGGTGIISSVLKMESTASTPQTYGLQLAYDQDAFDALGGGTSEAGVYVAWLNGDTWEKISTGTKYDSYTDGLTVGSWGIDTSNNEIWVVTDKAGSFAVVPEPGTLALVVAGVGGLLAYAWRKRK